VVRKINETTTIKTISIMKKVTLTTKHLEDLNKMIAICKNSSIIDLYNMGYIVDYDYNDDCAIMWFESIMCCIYHDKGDFCLDTTEIHFSGIEEDVNLKIDYIKLKKCKVRDFFKLIKED
jgi:hypothetical protein